MANPNTEGTSNPLLLTGGVFGVKIQSCLDTAPDAPAYAPGIIYFSLTDNKLKIGGATAFETVTSS